MSATNEAQSEAGRGGGHHPSFALYCGVYVALLGLTTLTFIVSQVAPVSVHMTVALLIASCKATLVALIFMHLKYSSGATRMTMVFSVGFVLILIAGILADIHTRYPLSNANESELSGVAERTLQARDAYGPLPAEAPVEHHE